MQTKRDNSTDTIAIVGDGTAASLEELRQQIRHPQYADAENLPAYSPPLIIDSSRKRRRERQYGRHDSWKSPRFYGSTN